MNTSELETLIRTILSEQLTTPAQTPVQPQGKGIFQSVSEAIDAAHQAFLRYQQCPLKTRSAIISAMRQELTPLLATLAEESASETGMGNKEDIAATAVATAHHLGHSLDETTLAQLCVSIEPTDSTVFHQLTLFDHNNAATQIACEPPPPIDLLVLESPVTLRTQDYHRLPRQQKLIASSATLQQAWNLVQEACITQNPLRLGEAATLSAIASQTLLPKPGFTALLSLVEECDLYGLNVAHSGSVVGLMLDRKRHDIARLKGKLAEKKLTRHWPKQHLLKMVTGGVKLQ
ncbi:GHMP kinase [Salmonella enterica]|nr:GHMP kinase [Salmonella enterica]